MQLWAPGKLHVYSIFELDEKPEIRRLYYYVVWVVVVDNG